MESATSKCSPKAPARLDRRRDLQHEPSRTMRTERFGWGSRAGLPDGRVPAAHYDMPDAQRRPRRPRPASGRLGRCAERNQSALKADPWGATSVRPSQAASPHLIADPFSTPAPKELPLRGKEPPQTGCGGSFLHLDGSAKLNPVAYTLRMRSTASHSARAWARPGVKYVVE